MWDRKLYHKNFEFEKAIYDCQRNGIPVWQRPGTLSIDDLSEMYPNGTKLWVLISSCMLQKH